MTLKRRSISILSCLLLPITVTAEPATVLSATTVYQSPATESTRLGTLPEGELVQVETRVGGWKQVSSEQQLNGWVRSYQVRSGELVIHQSEQESGGFFSGLASLSRKASGLFGGGDRDGGYSFQNTATIGVRGLSEEEIRNAQADFDQLNRMEKYRSNKKKARKFADKGHKVASKIPHIPKDTSK